MDWLHQDRAGMSDETFRAICGRAERDEANGEATIMQMIALDFRDERARAKPGWSDAELHVIIDMAREANSSAEAYEGARAALARRPEQWRTIASAPKNRDVWTFTRTKREGNEIVQKARWNQTLWINTGTLTTIYPQFWFDGNFALPSAPPAEDAEGGRR